MCKHWNSSSNESNAVNSTKKIARQWHRPTEKKQTHTHSLSNRSYSFSSINAFETLDSIVEICTIEAITSPSRFCKPLFDFYRNFKRRNIQKLHFSMIKSSRIHYVFNSYRFIHFETDFMHFMTLTLLKWHIFVIQKAMQSRRWDILMSTALQIPVYLHIYNTHRQTRAREQKLMCRNGYECYTKSHVK